MTGPATRGASSAALQALVAVSIWGASFAASKRVLAEASPETVLFVRTVLGMALVSGGLALAGRLRPLPAREWPRILLLALLGLFATQLLQVYALARGSTSATTAWLVALNPVVTAILATWLLGERLSGKVAGLALAFGGAVLVLTHGDSVAALLALPSTRGDLMTVVSTGTWALYTILGRGFVTRHDPPLVTAHLLITASLLYAPGFVLARGWQEIGTLSGPGWLCLLYLGIGCSGFAFMLYYGALEHLEASQVAAFIYVEPLIAQVLGALLLREPLSATVVLGGAAILAGVYLVSRAPSSA